MGIRSRVMGREARLAAPRTLREIALAHGCDKADAHCYMEAYESHFGRRRNDPVKLLEIGIGGYEDPRSGGASMRMWKEYFPLGTIVTLDIYDKSALQEERIIVVQGDQGDRQFLERIGSEFGPFDIVIDDGSHRSADIITSFGTLFRHTADDGIYAIEDLQTSYWERDGGSSDRHAGGTSMSMLKDLVDGLNYAEFDIPGYRPTETDRNTTSITFYHNLAFVQKGANLEPSNLLPPHPRDHRVRVRDSRLRRLYRSLLARTGRRDPLGRSISAGIGAFRVSRGIVSSAWRRLRLLGRGTRP